MLMRFISSLIFLAISFSSAFAFNVRDIDLTNNNNWGGLIIDGAIVLFILLFIVTTLILLLGRTFDILSKKKYTFSKITPLSKDKDYLREYLKLESVSQEFYSSTSSWIHAEDVMDRMKENKNVVFANPGEHYILCSFNVLSDYQKIRLLGDDNVYYAKIK